MVSTVDALGITSPHDFSLIAVSTSEDMRPSPVLLVGAHAALGSPLFLAKGVLGVSLRNLPGANGDITGMPIAPDQLAQTIKKFRHSLKDHDVSIEDQMEVALLDVLAGAVGVLHEDNALLDKIPDVARDGQAHVQQEIGREASQRWRC